MYQDLLKFTTNLSKSSQKVSIDALKLFMAIPYKINFLQMGDMDAFFSKETFVSPMRNNGFHIISRFRNDATLFYPTLFLNR